MNCTDVQNQLSDYADGDLPSAAHAALNTHLASCPVCRAALEGLRSLRAATAALPVAVAPARDLWAGIAARIEPERDTTDAALVPAVRSARFLRFALPLSAAAMLALSAALLFKSGAPPDGEAKGWDVTTVSGRPRVARQILNGDGRLGVGQWLETDANSRAKVAVGSIGEVTLDPNSRLRLVSASADDHRLELARGRMSAFIWAPPRLFFVETPSAVAVDLGCAYALDVDDAGNGELHVTSGYVALEHDGRDSIVPAGAKCLTRRGQGIGTPFVEDATPAFREALEQFDFGPGGGARAALRRILAGARREDAITLWHLLDRTSAADRASIFTSLAAHHPVPDGVTRDGIVAGDAAMRRLWANELGFGPFVSP